jgi:ankyrin repeat protein
MHVLAPAMSADAGVSLEQQLLEACRQGQAELARELLDEGAEPSYQDAQGVSPLMMAAESGAEAIVTALLGEVRPAGV